VANFGPCATRMIQMSRNLQPRSRTRTCLGSYSGFLFRCYQGALLWLSIEGNSSIFLIEAFILPQGYSMDTRTAMSCSQFCHYRLSGLGHCTCTWLGLLAKGQTAKGQCSPQYTHPVQTSVTTSHYLPPILNGFLIPRSLARKHVPAISLCHETTRPRDKRHSCGYHDLSRL
jgi:hypothetical protein